MENSFCKVHSTKKASHYCCIEKVLFCESCLKTHDGHLIYSLKEVEELKKTGVDLLKNLNNQNTKQPSSTNNKPSGPKIDLNALAASMDKKEDKNQISNKTVGTQNPNPIVNSVSSSNNSNNNYKSNNEQNNLINKPSNLVKSNTVSNIVLNNSTNQPKNTNANAVGNTSFSNALNSFISNEDKGKVATKEEKQTIEIDKPSINNINQNHLRAPKNELHLVNMIAEDCDDDFKTSNYNTYCAPSNNIANKINNLNEQSNKNIGTNKNLPTNAIIKSNDIADKNIKNNNENNAKEEDKVTVLPNEEKKLSIKDRLNQLNSNNKPSENNIVINKQTTLKQEDKKKENIQGVNPITPSNVIKNENKVSIQNYENKVAEIPEVRIENKTVIEVKVQETVKADVVIKEEAKTIEPIQKLENKAIEADMVDVSKEIKGKEKSESVIQKPANEEKKETNSTNNTNLSNKEVVNPIATQKPANEEKKETNSANNTNLSNKGVVDPIAIQKPANEDKKETNSTNNTNLSNKGVVNPVATQKPANEVKKEITPSNPIKANKEIVIPVTSQKAEETKEVIETPKSALIETAKNISKEEDKGNKIQNLLKTLEENNVKPKQEVKLNHYNTLKPSESKIAEKLNSLTNPIKEEKAPKIEAKEETVAANGNKNENFNKMKEMLGKRLSSVMGEKDVQRKEPEPTDQTNIAPTNVYQHTETTELKEVRKDNFKKAFADLNTCFVNRTKPKEGPPSINIPQISKPTAPNSKAPPIPNKMIPKPPMVKLTSKPGALSLPLPPPICLSNISTIPDRSKESFANKNSEGKANIPKAPPLILLTSEKKVIKTELKNEAPKEPKKQIKLPPPEPKKMSMLDELKKKVSLRSNNLNVKEEP